MAAFALASYMGGVPLVYSGQEVGCPIQLSFFKGGNTKIDWTKNAGTTTAYKKLINFRRESDAVQNGSLQIMNTNPDILIFKRISGSEEVVVMVNVRNKEVNATIPASLNATTWVNALSGSNVELGASMMMAPFQYLVLSNQ